MEVNLNDFAAFEPQYGVPIEKANTEHILNKTEPSQCLPEQSRSSYVQCVTFCRLITKSAEMLPLLQFCQ